MPGLSLGMSTGFMTPAAALTPSYAGTAAGATISSRAYGIAGASDPSAGRQTAGLGSTVIGAAATAALVWLWWTLPR